MNSCRDRCSEQLPEYFLDLLEPEEKKHVADHIIRCPECALEARILKQLNVQAPAEPDPWFFESLPGRVTAEAAQRGRKKRRMLVPLWAGGLAAAALAVFILTGPGPAPYQQAVIVDTGDGGGLGTYYTGLEDEILPVSGPILDDLDRQFVKDLEVLPPEYITSGNLVSEGDGYEMMDDETIRLFEDLVEEMTRDEGRNGVMS